MNAFWIIMGIVAIAAIGWLAVVVAHSKPTEQKPDETVEIPSDCCGEHAVCERDSLLTKTDKIIYFDDEELDKLAHRHTDDYTTDELKLLEEVFYTLREQDVAGWLRSLQLRDIALPEHLRDEALLIVSERRTIKV